MSAHADEFSGSPQERQNEPRILRATVPNECAGLRLDQVLGKLFGDFSRARMQHWIRDGRVEVDGHICASTRALMNGGEQLALQPALEPSQAWRAQPLPVELIHRDRDLLVVNKPAGLVVHPGAGNRDGTLVNALLHLDPGLAALPRAGLVHRLDKNTTGLLVVARSLRAHARLVAMIAAREVSRSYEAVVHGIPERAMRIDAPIARHPIQRTRMAVRAAGRHAVSHLRRLAAFRAHAHVAVDLETGRTHQIRVHLAHRGHPLVGDPDYGRRAPASGALSPSARGAVEGFARQALHAKRLGLAHPVHGRPLELEAELPVDMRALIAALADDASGR